MKLYGKKVLIGILGLTTIIGIIGGSLIPTLNRKEMLSYKENEEVKGLTTSTFSQTKAIIEKHKNDFNADTFDQFMAGIDGGYKGYLDSLGGVFKKYANFEGKVTTYSELEEVANYVFGIMAIWGFDYSADSGKRYYSYYDASARFYPERRKFGVENYGTEGIDTIASGGGNGMLANCNCGVDWTLRKAGLMKANDAVAYDFSDEISGAEHYNSMMQKYNAQKITDANKVQPGDIIIMQNEEGSFHTELAVARDNSTGKIGYYDSGSVALAHNGGQLTDRYKNERNIGQEPWPWEETYEWYAVRLPFGLTNDTDGTWDGTKYKRSNGTYAKNEWVKIVGEMYYFDSAGNRVTGFKDINNAKYYFDENGRMKTGWLVIRDEGTDRSKDKKYYFSEDPNTKGQMAIGWKNINVTISRVTKSFWFYFVENDNQYPGFDKGRALLGNRRVTRNGKENDYYFCVTNGHVAGYPAGAMLTGWRVIKDDGEDRSKDKKYYFSEDPNTIGQMAIGWKNINVTISGVTKSFWFYFVENDNQYNGFDKGRALLGDRLVTRNGKENYYYFCVTNAHVEGYPAGAMIHDMEFRGKRYDSSGAYIDEIAPEVEVTYNPNEATSGNVQVTLKANEVVKAVDGWNLSTDRLKLTKEYSNNKTENISVTDIAGNTTAVTIKVNNIDKTGPVLDISYSETELTNKGVLVTITADEKIQPVEGWAIDAEGKTLTKEYRENVKEEIEVSDILGNKSNATIEITNIYETSLVKSNYKVDSDIILVDNLGETVKSFKNNNEVKARSIKVVNTQGVEISDGDIIGTGYKFVLDGTLIYKIAVLGDCNGDGKASVREVARIQRSILDSLKLEDIELKALDFNGTGRLEVSDLAKECKIILGV